MDYRRFASVRIVGIGGSLVEELVAGLVGGDNALFKGGYGHGHGYF